MKTIYTILREDFGLLDRNLVRSELLCEPGVHSVMLESCRNGLTIEYDPDVVDDTKLAQIMLRYGVLPPPAGYEPRGASGAS